MKPTGKKKPYKKIALALSLCTLIIWGILGTGASLAWFADTSEEVTNIFQLADFDLQVHYRSDAGVWEELKSDSVIFNENALYEPGYTQVVYLRVKNAGTRAFNFQTAINVTDSSVSTNVFGQDFWLHEHLKFGVATAVTESEMEAKVATRELARQVAVDDLGSYSSDVAPLNPNAEAFMAVVVRMPEEVGNEANHLTGVDAPCVSLGIVVKADQQK